MIWLTWRQHRLEGLIAALLVVVVAGLVGSLVVAAQPLLEQIKHVCPIVVDDSCGRALTAFNARFGMFQQPLNLAFVVLPALSGMFIGAPLLAREFEQGTDEMVWTQGITRRKWLFIKVAILGSATIAMAGILAVAGHEWSTAVPADSYNQWFAFDVQGPEFVAYALFSFALGVAAGAAIGRTVPAMAVVLVGFLAVRAAIELFVRRNFIPPVESELAGPRPAAAPASAGGWRSRRNAVGDAAASGGSQTSDQANSAFSRRKSKVASTASFSNCSTLDGSAALSAPPNLTMSINLPGREVAGNYLTSQLPIVLRATRSRKRWDRRAPPMTQVRGARPHSRHS